MRIADNQDKRRYDMSYITLQHNVYLYIDDTPTISTIINFNEMIEDPMHRSMVLGCRCLPRIGVDRAIDCR